MFGARFVFWGVLLVAGAIIAAYAAWLIRTERRPD